MHCVANGHDIVALANLCPPPSAPNSATSASIDEMDSFCFQTVGHDAVEGIAACMDIPLVRQWITGTALQAENVYRPPSPSGPSAASPLQHDEVEDLLALLKTVVARFPSVQGVSVGAILSNYQRVRVENVCARLGLRVFAYLWRQDQQQLLEHMFACHLDAVIVKVAAMGLSRRDLGHPLQQVFPKLVDLHEQYDVHIAGEGGEYETLVVDCPLFKRKLVLEEMDVVIHSDDGCAEVAYLSVKRYRTEEKPPANIAPIWERLRKNWTPSLELPPCPRNWEPFRSVSPGTVEIAPLHIHSSDPYLIISNLRASSLSSNIAVQTCSLLETLQSLLHERQVSISHVLMTYVYLADMADFQSVNAVYARYFGQNHPAARACIALPMASEDRDGNPAAIGHRVWMSVVASNVDTERMHVQSISNWAPANIGPYSQAVRSIKSSSNGSMGRVFIAGQIGMIPSTLEIPDDISLETELSLQHVVSIANAFLRYHSSPAVLCPSSELPRSDNETEWRCTPISEQAQHSSFHPHPSPALFFVCYITSPAIIPLAKKALKQTLRGYQAPLLFVTVEALPKQAHLEWEVQLWDPLNYTSARELTSLSEREERTIGGVFSFTNDKQELVQRLSFTRMLDNERHGDEKPLTTVKLLRQASTNGEDTIGIWMKDLLELNAKHPWLEIRIFYRPEFLERSLLERWMLDEQLRPAVWLPVHHLDDGEQSLGAYIVMAALVHHF